MKITRSRLKQIIAEEISLGFGQGKPTSDEISKKREVYLEEDDIDEGVMDKLAQAAKSTPVKVLKLQLRKLSGTKRADFVVQIIRNLLDNDEKALAGLANRLSGVKRGLTEPEGQAEQPTPEEV